jgi:hypothetical protein
MRKLLFALLLLPVLSFAQGTTTQIRHGGTLPSSCSPSNGDVFFKTGTAPGLYDCPATNTWRLIATAASGTPGGSDTQIQFNCSSAFCGDSKFTYDSATGTLTIGNGTDPGMISILGRSTTPSGAELPGTGKCGWWYDNVAGQAKFIDHSGASCGPSGGSGTVTSSGSPSSGNIAKFTNSTDIAPAAASNVVSLFNSGTCSGYLKSDGTCDTPSGGSGSEVKLCTLTLSGSSAGIFSAANCGGSLPITSTYQIYKVQVRELVPSTGMTVNLQVSTDGCSTYDTTSGHYYTSQMSWSTGGVGGGGPGSGTSILLAPFNGRTLVTTSGISTSGRFFIYNPLGTALNKTFTGEFFNPDSASANPQGLAMNASFLQNTTAFNCFKIFPSTGTISGVITIYGVTQ